MRWSGSIVVRVVRVVYILHAQYLDRIQTLNPNVYFIIVIYTQTRAMSISVQAAPQAPSYDAASIQVPANIATPQATMDAVKAQQGQLNAVNTLSGGRSRSRRQGRGRSHKSFIRTYKGRRYIPKQQQGGSSGGAIVIPQVGSTCSAGPQCAGAQNANFTAIHNQAQSNSINDAYATQKGGRKKVRFSHATARRRRSHRRPPRHDQSLTSMVAYNIKKVLRKVFS